MAFLNHIQMNAKKILTLGLKNYIISGSIIFNIFLHLSNIYVRKCANIKLFCSWRERKKKT